jgi:hypothetical protein
MELNESRWTDWLREQPPVWPRRVAERTWRGQRWQREPEPFEDRGGYEMYPGATVLEDLAAEVDEGALLRILARYTVVRLLTLSVAGRLAGPKLRTERRVALEHLALLPPHDWERHALERLAHVCTEAPEPGVVAAALIAAECAAKRDQCLGAFALYRAAYELSRDNGWWDEAARAAGGIAQLAGLNEAPVSVRVWQWRSRVLEERRRRAAESADGD